jgi:hypothetical protein
MSITFPDVGFFGTVSFFKNATGFNKRLEKKASQLSGFTATAIQ